MSTARLMPLHEARSFVDPRTGQLRELADPGGPPSARQLLWLWHAGALAVVFPDNESHQFTRAQAAGAIAWLRGDAA